MKKPLNAQTRRKFKIFWKRYGCKIVFLIMLAPCLFALLFLFLLLKLL
jgi:hypothetical protein